MSNADKRDRLADKRAKLLELLKEKVQEDENDTEEVYDDAHLQKLKDSYATMLKSHSFSKGQIVKWKVGLRNRKLPKENQPAIVWEILSEPIIQDDQDTGTPYFREKLDIALALLDKEGDFIVYHYDSRRFEPF
jgi:hypothetical protein